MKGIEPSYSAWKAAALPLSYTRVRGSLTRPDGGLNCRDGDFSAPHRPDEPASVPADRPPLNSGSDAAYIEISRNQRKEVIQCLLPSAVTSLGSPAKLRLQAWHRGALSPGPASKKSGATGPPRRAFCFAMCTWDAPSRRARPKPHRTAASSKSPVVCGHQSRPLPAAFTRQGPNRVSGRFRRLPATQYFASGLSARATVLRPWDLH